MLPILERPENFRMKQKLAAIEQNAVTAAAEVTAEAELQQVKATYLGRKGALTAIMKDLGQLPVEERPQVGALVNEVKARLEEVFAHRQETLQQQLLSRRLAEERIDVTLPGRGPRLGHRHPISRTMSEIIAIFQRLGFSIRGGPEIEKEVNELIPVK